MAFSFQTGTQQPITSTASTFGVPAASTGSAFSFGTPAATSQQQPATAPATQFSFGTGLGAQPTTATSAAPAAASAFSFGTPAVSAAAAPSAFGAPQQQPGASSFSFAPPASVPSATSQGFGFGLNVAPTLTSTQAVTTPAAPVVISSSFGGLGGVPSSGAANTPIGFGFSGGLNPASKSNDPRAVKELPVPVEVMQIIEELKLHMKNHKVKMTEMNRATDKSIEKVVEETEDSRIAISQLSNMVNRQGLFCQSLMRDIQEEMKNVDMAMVTRDTPLVLQNEITAPANYFYRLVSNYQDRMLSYKREIERAELALSSLVESHGFAPRDLITALKATKETVMSLAAKIQDYHEQVVSEVATHRNLKRFAVGDTTVNSSWANGGTARSTSAGGHGSMFGLSISDGGHGSITRMEPVIPSSVNASYHRSYDKVNVLFNTPPRAGDQRYNSSYNRPGAITSTPAFPRTGFPGYSSPPSLFQTASSTILGSPGIPGSSLKRSKR